MEIEIRKLESYTIVESTEPIRLNIEDFRMCIPPFIGETHEDFFTYFNDIEYIEDFIESNKEVLSEEVCDKLFGLEYENEYQIIHDSRTKFGDTWLEYGETNKKLVKNGEFETLGSSNY
jgi:hypothetical protein